MGEKYGMIFITYFHRDAAEKYVDTNHPRDCIYLLFLIIFKSLQ